MVTSTRPLLAGGAACPSGGAVSVIAWIPGIAWDSGPWVPVDDGSSRQASALQGRACERA